MDGLPQVQPLLPSLLWRVRRCVLRRGIRAVGLVIRLVLLFVLLVRVLSDVRRRHLHKIRAESASGLSWRGQVPNVS